MRHLGALLVVVAVVGCMVTPSAAPTSQASAPPGGTASAAPPASPSGSGAGTAGATDPRCADESDECVLAHLRVAVELTEGIPTEIDVDEPPSFSGGQRTSDWIVYLADTVSIVNGFWSRAFAAGNIPYIHVYYVLVDSGQPGQRSNCVDDRGAQWIANANGGPFYCGIGGQAFGRWFESGTVYIGVPLLVSEASRVNPRNFDFAVVAMVAHEMGHHVQRVLLNRSLTSSTSATWGELSADCLSGVFAHNAYFGRAGQLTDTDFSEATQFLWNWGSDLPYYYSGDPHGSRQQRVDAFKQGYNTGNTSQCLSTYWPTF